MENIFLTAQSLGLGSCYINQLHWLRNDVNVRDYLSELGDSQRTYHLLSVGNRVYRQGFERPVF